MIDVCVISTGRNCGEWAGRCVRSVQRQVVHKGVCLEHVVISDSSTDDTVKHVAAALRGPYDVHPQETGHGTCSENLYRAVHELDPATVVVWLDLDDWLSHDGVINLIAHEYEHGRWDALTAPTETWATYGQFIHYPEPHRGWAGEYPARVVRDGSYRDEPWAATHLKTFRAGLFHAIDQADLRHLLPAPHACDPEWITEAVDLAVMFPILEMAREHAHFIPDILYVYNTANATSANNDTAKRAAQLAEARRICAMPRYERLIKRPW